MSIENLDDFQREIGEWGRQAFPDSTAGTIADHLAEEMVELLGVDRVQEAVRRAMDKGEYQPSDNPAEESADILLILCDLADRLNFDLRDAARKKFEEVKDAEWVDDGRGYKKRVKK